MISTSLSRGSSVPFFFSSRSDGRIVAVNAIVFPSGDQAIDSTERDSEVSACGSPPLIDSRKPCDSVGFPFFSPTRRNASVFPSGDQRGAESRGPFVRRRGSPPAIGTDQSDVAYRSSFSSTVTRTNATCEPSGERRGSPIHWNL